MATRTQSKTSTVLLAGFANPRYLGGVDQADATGFDISDGNAVVVFVNSGPTTTIVCEQTLDRAGLTGWQTVNAVNIATGAIGAPSPNAAFIVPALGTRMRLRVTALTVADLVASFAVHQDVFEGFPLSLGAGSNIIGATPLGASATVGVGTSHFKVATAAAVLLASVKASAGKLFGMHLTNNAAAARFVKLYNKASAPVVASDTPIATFGIPAGGQLNYFNPVGKAFATGIAIAITAAVGDTDATANAVNDVTGGLDFI